MVFRAIITERHRFMCVASSPRLNRARCSFPCFYTLRHFAFAWQCSPPRNRSPRVHTRSLEVVTWKTWTCWAFHARGSSAEKSIRAFTSTLVAQPQHQAPQVAGRTLHQSNQRHGTLFAGSLIQIFVYGWGAFSCSQSQDSLAWLGRILLSATVTTARAKLIDCRPCAKRDTATPCTF